MKVLSLYCGGGGVDEGLKQAGIETTLAIDNWKPAIETMKANHDCETILSDVKDVKDSLDKFDIIVGGPPCPEFSNAKIDKTFDPTEVNFFLEILDKLQPKYHLMENVPGVIKVCKRRNFLINCANYGTPQTRTRRFYTNLLEPKRTHAKIPTNTLFESPMKKWVSVKDVLNVDGILEDRKTTFGEGFREYDINKPSFTLVTDSRIFISPTGFNEANEKLISRTIDEPVQTIVCANEYKFTDKPIYSQKYIKFRNPEMYKKHPPKELNKPSGTIRSSFAGDVSDFLVDGINAVKLQNKHIALLQGFPKDYKFIGNKTDIRKLIGNAVPPQPIKALFSGIVN